jgi:hypothetical protein
MYSWPPFESGNTAAMRHGAKSPRTVQPLADQFTAGLLEAAPWTGSPAFAPTVKAWAYSEAQAELLRAWIDEHGLVDEDGVPRGAVDFHDRVEKRAAKLRAELGLTPQSLGQLLRNAASVAVTTGDTASLDALKAEAQQVLDVRMAELGAGDG